MGFFSKRFSSEGNNQVLPNIIAALFLESKEDYGTVICDGEWAYVNSQHLSKLLGYIIGYSVLNVIRENIEKKKVDFERLPHEQQTMVMLGAAQQELISVFQSTTEIVEALLEGQRIQEHRSLLETKTKNLSKISITETLAQHNDNENYNFFVRMERINGKDLVYGRFSSKYIINLAGILFAKVSASSSGVAAVNAKNAIQIALNAGKQYIKSEVQNENSVDCKLECIKDEEPMLDLNPWLEEKQADHEKSNCCPFDLYYLQYRGAKVNLPEPGYGMHLGEILEKYLMSQIAYLENFKHHIAKASQFNQQTTRSFFAYILQICDSTKPICSIRDYNNIADMLSLIVQDCARSIMRYHPNRRSELINFLINIWHIIPTTLVSETIKEVEYLLRYDYESEQAVNYICFEEYVEEVEVKYFGSEPVFPQSAGGRINLFMADVKELGYTKLCIAVGKEGINGNKQEIFCYFKDVTGNEIMVDYDTDIYPLPLDGNLEPYSIIAKNILGLHNAATVKWDIF